MARKRYFPRPTHAVFGTAFDTPEEAWLWAARSVRIAAEGAQTAADRAVVQRPCEPRDLIALVCRLRRQRVLNGYEMHALCAFGAIDRPPDPRDPEEARHDRFWQSGLDRLTGPLVRKGIVLPRRSEMREFPLDLKKNKR